MISMFNKLTDWASMPTVHILVEFDALDPPALS